MLKVMMNRKRWGLLGGTAVIIVILMWPVGTWLQCRDMHVGDENVDAIYLVAGAQHQRMRIGALERYLASQNDIDHIRFLVGWDALGGGWSLDLQGNPLMHEFAMFKIRRLCENHGAKDSIIAVIPGGFTGTDGEMEVLAEYLADTPEIMSMAVVTSPFHIRRVVNRLHFYLKRNIQIRVICPDPRWNDRSPWTVLFELCKMARDKMGLSRVPVLSRE